MEKMKTLRVSSGTVWEDIVGYSRGIRVGNTIEIAGTTAVDEAGNLVGDGDPYEQTRFIINKAKTAIEKLGGRLEHVTRTRIFVTDINRWDPVGKAHGEFFSAIKPAVTMVEVSALIDPAMMVEIEFTAVVRE